ncbi:MAG: hypothetical protein QXT28_06915 [Thermofilaceae archaeon]
MSVFEAARRPAPGFSFKGFTFSYAKAEEKAARLRREHYEVQISPCFVLGKAAFVIWARRGKRGEK